MTARKLLARIGLATPLLGVFLLASCAGNGHVSMLGYTTQPNYDTDIHTVLVPVFQNLTIRDSSRDGLEFELTRAVIRQIEQTTPYKVVGPDRMADTELLGTITMFNKNILNRNQLNEVREAEMVLAVEVVWRDLRTGEILSQNRIKIDPLPIPIDAPLPSHAQPPAIPNPTQSTGNFIPELGPSMASARKKATDALAVQITSMMEKSW